MGVTVTRKSGKSPVTAGTEMLQPMRSFLMVSVRDDNDLPAAYRWLYRHHIPDGISQFAPYVTKYATYRALPLPSGAEDFGTYNWIMTEHHFLLSPFGKLGLAFAEYFDEQYLELTRQPVGGELRPGIWSGSREGYHPTAMALTPIFWEDDLKGADRTIEDGPNYRWLIMFKYPPSVSREIGDRWFLEIFAAALIGRLEVNRFLSSRVLDDPCPGPFDRVAEIWFDDSKGWGAAIAAVRTFVEKPSWAEWDQFPFLEPYKDLVGEFLLDRPESDHLQQYRGYISTR